MTDQDRKVDGVAGGTADAGGARAGGGEGGGGAEAASPTNVVPFPGNWFGSVDELVPITQDADAHGRDSGAVSAAGPQNSPADLPPHDASAFWDGEAPSVQAMLPTPGELDSMAGAIQEDWFAAKPAGATAATEREPSEAQEPVAVGRQGDGSRSGTIRVAMVAFLMCALAAGCAVVLTQANLFGRGPHGASRATTAGSRVHAPGLTVTDPVTVTRTVPAREHRGSRAGGRKLHAPNRSATDRHTSGRTSSNAAATGRTSGAPLSSAGAGSSAGPSSSGGGPSSSGEHSTGPSSTAGSERQVSGQSSTSHLSAGSPRGCVQSPDSGCLP